MRAIANPIAPVCSSRAAVCQQVVSPATRCASPAAGSRLTAGAGLHAGVRLRAAPHGDAVRDARSRERHAEHGHLPRCAQGRPTGSAVRMAARVGGAGGYLHWLKYRARKEPHADRHRAGHARPWCSSPVRRSSRVDSDEADGRGRACGAPIRKTTCVAASISRCPRDAEIVIEGLIDTRCSSPRRRSARATATSRSKRSTCRCASRRSRTSARPFSRPSSARSRRANRAS